MNGSISLKMWVAVGVPILAFLTGILAVGAWKGEITNRIKVVEVKAESNKQNTKKQ